MQLCIHLHQVHSNHYSYPVALRVQGQQIYASAKMQRLFDLCERGAETANKRQSEQAFIHAQPELSNNTWPNQLIRSHPKFWSTDQYLDTRQLVKHNSSHSSWSYCTVRSYLLCTADIRLNNPMWRKIQIYHLCATAVGQVLLPMSRGVANGIYIGRIFWSIYILNE